MTGALAQAPPMPEATFPTRLTHPLLACDAVELARLRQAYAGGGEEQKIVEAVIAQAKVGLAQPLVFPPRGGQHNQWYQCPACEMGLKTVDETHHQCPKCQKMYSGPPYDDVIFSAVHGRIQYFMFQAAWAYAITGERRYADYTARVLLGYAERYRQYPYHTNRLTDQGTDGGRLYEQTLTEASALTRRIAPAYDLIHDSGVLSEADHRAIHQGLLIPMLENLDKRKAGKSNWQSWHNAAMVAGGIVLHDPAWIRKALYDEKNGFLFQMGACVSDEGMWYENSWGYHFYTLGALTATAEGARRIGIDLWQEARFARMFTLPALYAMPNGSLPRFGDDVNTTVAGANYEMEAMYRAHPLPEILALLPTTPTFSSIQYGRKIVKTAAPALRSAVFPDAGHAILRGRGEAELTAAMTFGPFGGFHGHFDKLSFVFFGYGQELGVDPGRAASQAYRLPIHGQWYRATLSHNTVLVDTQAQQPAAGKLESFVAKDGYAAVTASCDSAYAGVKHQRTLVMLPEYLLVVDTLLAETPRRFDWVYHNRGDAAQCEAATVVGQMDEKYVGLSYLGNLRQGVTSDPVRVRFAAKDVSVHLTMAPAPETGVLLGDGPGSSVLERIPLAMITRQGARVTFVAVLEPVKAGGTATTSSVHAVAHDGKTTIRVQRDTGDDEVVMIPGKPIVVQRNGKVI